MDPYEAIAPFYDLEHAGFRDDVEYYLNLLHEGPVLEIGAGTGRIMQPLLEAGFEVWGVDSSEIMLKVARQRVGELRGASFVLSSVLDLHLDLRFAAVILPLNVLWHLLSAAEQVQALSVCAGHLRPDGLLCVDMTNPLSMADRGASGELRMAFQHISSDRRVVRMSAAWDDEGEQQLRLHIMYDETDALGRVTRTHSNLVLRYVYRSEIELMLRLAGLRVAQIYGGYDLEPYGEGSPNLIAVAVHYRE